MPLFTQQNSYSISVTLLNQQGTCRTDEFILFYQTKLFYIDISVSIRNLHQKKMLILLPVLGTVSNSCAKKIVVDVAELVAVFFTAHGFLSPFLAWHRFKQ